MIRPWPPGQWIAAIAAISRNRALGVGGGLPWDIPEDVAFFEGTVQGAALLVGRLTYFTMPDVPEDTFVVTRDTDLPVRGGARRVGSVEEGLAAALATGKPVFVIGGGGIYEAAWPYCRYLYLTRIDADFPGDAYFPAVDLSGMKLCWQEQRDLLERRSSQYVRCEFLCLERESAPVPPISIANAPGVGENRV